MNNTRQIRNADPSVSDVADDAQSAARISIREASTDRHIERDEFDGSLPMTPQASIRSLAREWLQRSVAAWSGLPLRPFPEVGCLVSQRFRFVWVRVPKVASTSIADALRDPARGDPKCRRR